MADNMDERELLLMTCYKYQFHGKDMLIFWGLQLITFMTIYCLYIKSKGVKMQIWTCIIMFAQLFTLLIIIGADLYGYFTCEDVE